MREVCDLSLCDAGARQFGSPGDPRPTLVLANRSDIDLDRQVRAPGATWLDYRLVEREPMPLAMSGFGQEVRNAMQARAEHLAADGLAGRRPQRRALGVPTLHYLDGRIMGGIVGRTLSHDVERAWGFVVRAVVGHAGKYWASFGYVQTRTMPGTLSEPISGLSSGLFAPSSGFLFLFTPKTAI